MISDVYLLAFSQYLGKEEVYSNFITVFALSVHEFDLNSISLQWV